MLYAEIQVETKKTLSDNLESSVKKYFTEPVKVRNVIDATAHTGSYDWEDQVIYAHSSNSIVYLIFNPDVHTLKVHVESGDNQKRSIINLRHCIEQVDRKMTLFLEGLENKVSKEKILIYANDDHFQAGRKLNWLDKFKEALKGHVAGEVYVPIVTYIASLALGYDTKQVLLNVVVALGAVLLWTALDVSFIRDSLVYTEE